MCKSLAPCRTTACSSLSINSVRRRHASSFFRVLADPRRSSRARNAQTQSGRSSGCGRPWKWTSRAANWQRRARRLFAPATAKLPRHSTHVSSARQTADQHAARWPRHERFGRRRVYLRADCSAGPLCRPQLHGDRSCPHGGARVARRLRSGVHDSVFLATRKTSSIVVVPLRTLRMPSL